MNVKMTRGMRNNNPCNIRKNPHTWWKGAINGRDPEFVTFSDKAYGYRAVFITLNTYNRTHNIWSPPINKVSAVPINRHCGLIKILFSCLNENNRPNACVFHFNSLTLPILYDKHSLTL